MTDPGGPGPERWEIATRLETDGLISGLELVLELAEILGV